MITEKVNSKNFFYFFVLLYFLTRLYFLQSGVTIRGFEYWQITNLFLLQEDFLKSIYYFHYQPPLWNILIGFIIKLAGSSQVFAKNILIFIHWLFSIGIMYIIYQLKLKMNYDKKIFIIALFLIVFNPSIIFFENFPLYNHFSCFIFFLLFYNFYLLSVNKNNKFEYYILSLSLILTLTWPLFHPLFIILIFMFNCYLKAQFKLKSLILSLIFFVLSLTPSIKNKYEFGFFGNGSGLGQNMSGLIYWNNDLRQDCSYNNLTENKDLEKIKIKHPSLLYHNHVQNSLEALNKSDYCLKNSINEIKKNFVNYFVYRLRVLLASHNRFSFEYFQPPIKFNDFFDIFQSLKKDDLSWSLKKILINIFFMFYYLILLIYFFRIKDDKNFKKASFCIFLLHFYILIVGTFLNNQEQERFRYTSGIFLNFLFIYVLVKYGGFIRRLISLKKIIS